MEEYVCWIPENAMIIPAKTAGAEGGYYDENADDDIPFDTSDLLMGIEATQHENKKLRGHC